MANSYALWARHSNKTVDNELVVDLFLGIFTHLKVIAFLVAWATSGRGVEILTAGEPLSAVCIFLVRQQGC
jgi:hypothetical protein